jgi:hypothetical protein
MVEIIAYVNFSQLQVVLREIPLTVGSEKARSYT